MSPLNVIGVDQSVSHTAIHHASGRESIQTKPKDYIHKLSRLSFIAARFENIVAPMEPGVAYVEGYGFAAQQAHTLGEVGGALQLILYQLGWRVVLVPPTVLKKFITGKGNTEKDGMRMKAAVRFGYESIDNNDCDAFCLRVFGLTREATLQLANTYPAPCKHPTKEEQKLFTKVEELYPGAA